MNEQNNDLRGYWAFDHFVRILAPIRREYAKAALPAVYNLISAQNNAGVVARAAIKSLGMGLGHGVAACAFELADAMMIEEFRL